MEVSVRYLSDGEICSFGTCVEDVKFFKTAESLGYRDLIMQTSITHQPIACALTMRPDHVCIKYCMSVNCFWRARCQWAVRMIDRLQSSLLICSKSPLPRQDRGVGPEWQFRKMIFHQVLAPRRCMKQNAPNRSAEIFTKCRSRVYAIPNTSLRLAEVRGIACAV